MTGSWLPLSGNEGVLLNTSLPSSQTLVAADRQRCLDLRGRIKHNTQTAKRRRRSAQLRATSECTARRCNHTTNICSLIRHSRGRHPASHALIVLTKVLVSRKGSNNSIKIENKPVGPLIKLLLRPQISEIPRIPESQGLGLKF